jgi:hypothetical protein
VVAAKAVKLELDLERGKMGKLIGVGGKTIQVIQQRAPGVHLRTPTKDETGNSDYKFVPVTITGRSDQAFMAAFLVNDVSPVCLAVLTAQMKPSDTTLLLSRERIVNLQKEVTIDTLRLPKKNDKSPKVVIEGFLEDVVPPQPSPPLLPNLAPGCQGVGAENVVSRELVGMVDAVRVQSFDGGCAGEGVHAHVRGVRAGGAGSAPRTRVLQAQGPHPAAHGRGGG